MSNSTKNFQPNFNADDDGDAFPFAPLADADAGSSSSTTSAATLASIPTLANYLINGFWQYNDTVAHHFGSSTITYNISALNANEQMLAQSAMNAWHEVANLNFVQTSGTANITFTHDGTMTAYSSSNYGGSITSSAIVNISADWITNDGGAYDGRTGIDSYGYQTYIHEIGHALGLGHQGPYNGSANYSTNALFTDDTWQYSVMSYFAQNNFGGSYRYVVTPQMADIYAIQSIYGAATTRAGDTVYGFHNTAGSIYNFSNYSQAPALTIYDSGGNDTLDCSGYSNAQIIDLHAGAFSSIGGLTKNIGIALNASIENAIGGSGNDTLIANDLGCTLTGGGGNDTLTGGAGIDRLVGGIGVDVLTGGGGADTFAFVIGESSAASGQHDRISDFVSGVDRIDLSGIDAIAATGAYDLFHFIGASAFDGTAGALDYFYNSTLGVTVVQGDTNGDRVADFAIDLSGNIVLGAGDFVGVVSVPQVVIEAFGSTSLVQIGNNYILRNIATGTGPSLTSGNGTPFAAGQAGTWLPIGVEQTSTGYQVAWRATGTDQYSVWATDSNGVYTGNVIGVVSGNSAAWNSFESSFHQDLSGNGVIGAPAPPPTVIEASGSTSLVQVGDNYHLNSITTGTGPSLTSGNGTLFGAGQAGTWLPIGVEQTATGYQVAWRATGADQYSVWATDSNGVYISNVIGAVSGNSTTLISFETSFHQDLNGDGVIGGPVVPPAVIEASGSTSLIQVGGNYHLNSIATGTGPSLTSGNGTLFAAGEAGNWLPIAVEQTSTGYQVAWRATGADQYSVWATDSNGVYISNVIGAVSGNSTTLISFETSFHQDLNGDGVIGGPVVPPAVIEASGSTSLIQVGGNYHLNSIATGTGPSLTSGNGTLFAAGEAGNWLPIAVEQTSTGYQVAWRGMGTDQYSVWATDSHGVYTGNVIGAVSGNSTTLISFETSFHQDLNGDGVIGTSTSQAPLEVAAHDMTADTFLFRPATDPIWNAGSGDKSQLNAFYFADTPTGLPHQEPVSAGGDLPGNHDMAVEKFVWADPHADHFIIH